MTANIIAITDFLKKIDPARIKEIYPTREEYDKYLKLRTRAGTLLEKVTVGGLSPTFASELEALDRDMSAAAEEISPKTFIGGKILLNQIVTWSESHHLERAIYLAGQCEGKKIREPYRTQIRLQPANACMTRYRQTFQILEYIKINIQANPTQQIGDTIAGMLKALLEQFEYFSAKAFEENKNHVFARYMLALSKLMRAHERLAVGRKEESDDYIKMATDIIDNINEPSINDQTVELNYHIKNFHEFKGFKRLSKAHPRIHNRLKFLSEKASTILSATENLEEKPYFWFSGYVGGTARAASIVGLICTTAAAFGMDLESAKDAIEKTWDIAIQSIPGLQNDASQAESAIHLSMHTGGLVGPQLASIEDDSEWLSQMGSLIHTGGLV